MSIDFFESWLSVGKLLVDKLFSNMYILLVSQQPEEIMAQQGSFAIDDVEGGLLALKVELCKPLNLDPKAKGTTVHLYALSTGTHTVDLPEGEYKKFDVTLLSGAAQICTDKVDMEQFKPRTTTLQKEQRSIQLFIGYAGALIMIRTRRY
jgi:hypothetical protein